MFDAAIELDNNNSDYYLNKGVDINNFKDNYFMIIISF